MNAVDRGVDRTIIHRMTDGSTDAILKETVTCIHDTLGPDIDELRIERVVIGIFFTGVKLNNGDGGICFTPIKEIPEAVCCPSSARTMPSPGKMKGQKVMTVLGDMWHSPLKKAIGIATLNALSVTCWNRRPPEEYVIQNSVNAFDYVDVPDDTYVLVIGALVPILKSLKQGGNTFGILELDPTTLKPDELEHLISAEEAPAEIRKADILIITGTTLINDTLEGILVHARPDAKVLLVGPTASMLPDAFFARGVDAIGGIIVNEPDELLEILSEGGSGYHFFGKSADRVIIKKTEE